MDIFAPFTVHLQQARDTVHGSLRSTLRFVIQSFLLFSLSPRSFLKYTCSLVFWISTSFRRGRTEATTPSVVEECEIEAFPALHSSHLCSFRLPRLRETFYLLPCMVLDWAFPFLPSSLPPFLLTFTPYDKHRLEQHPGPVFGS